MIARHWAGRIKPEEAENYVQYLQEEILPHLSEMKGFSGASIRKRKLQDSIEFLFISEWDSEEAIKQFAGEDISTAVVAEKAQRMMLNFDKEVRHYEIVSSI